MVLKSKTVGKLFADDKDAYDSNNVFKFLTDKNGLAMY
jgi:hypothetical protein